MAVCKYTFATCVRNLSLSFRKHAHQQTCLLMRMFSSVKEVPDGVDFYFLCRHHAINSRSSLWALCHAAKKSWQLISEDFNNNKINATWTFSAEIVPVCKDDVICIHPRQYSQQDIFICVGVPSLPLLLGRLFLHVRPAMHALACTHTRANVHSSSQVAWISGVRNALQRSELEVHSTLFLQLFHRHVCVVSFASTAI